MFEYVEDLRIVQSKFYIAFIYSCSIYTGTGLAPTPAAGAVAGNMSL